MAYRNKKIIWGCLFTFTLLSYPQTPAFTALPHEGFELPQLYRFTTSYGFVLVNRASYPIRITLKNNNMTLLSDFLINPSSPEDLKGVMAKIEINKPTILTIASEDTKDKSYQFPIGKTLYMTYDKEGILRPQIGQMYGLKPESKAGFVLTHNLQPGDIKPTSSPQY